MAEVYWMALLRDKPLTEFDDASSGADSDVEDAITHLRGLEFYETAIGKHPRRRRLNALDALTRQNVFRGHTPGERKGPYLSQFMLMGDRHLNNRTPGGMTTSFGSLRYCQDRRYAARF